MSKTSPPMTGELAAKPARWQALVYDTLCPSNDWPYVDTSELFDALKRQGVLRKVQRKHRLWQGDVDEVRAAAIVWDAEQRLGAGDWR